ncbi:MAG: APC family permease [Fusobacteriaceae bacterium]|jgi:APA family basic amino acid/polyamine antiporter|nr:APC family permease [Fusobacteriaceae bacterium]
MENITLKKKYGLMTAIAMVIGIVIGSGVFFKAEKVLTATGGDLPLGIGAWVIGGLIMIVCAYVFATMAAKYEKISGLVDYAEVVIGKKYAYYLGWFMAIIYTPTLTSVLAWVSARYTCVLLGWDITGGPCMTLACLYLIAIYVMNMLTPLLAGKFQIGTTAIKLIPLVLMAVIGTIAGLRSGMTIRNFSSVAAQEMNGSPLFTAVVATAFAYEGWIIATTINAELRDAKKNLPRALTVGTLVIMAVYILYYVGLAGAVPNALLMESGEQGARIAFMTIFGKWGGVLLMVLVVISCLGTLNGLMMGCVRNQYALAIRGNGPAPYVFAQVDPVTNMPLNSGNWALLLCGIWLFFFYGANLTSGWFGPFKFDSSELPIVALYAMYLPIFFLFIKKERDLPVFKRVVMPSLAIAACVFMIIAAIFAHGKAVLWFLLVFAIVMAVGALYGKEI